MKHIIKFTPEKFRDFLETHYEVVRFIETRLAIPDNNLSKTYDNSGFVFLYNLAAEWTKEFENKHEGTDWTGMEWWETLEAFLTQKESELI